MLDFWYVCDVNPVPWQLGPVSGRRGKGGGTYASVGRDEELFTYKEAIKEALRAQSPKKLEGELILTCYFWRTLVESTSLKNGRKLTKSQADATNMLKSTEDACQGILFDNDKSNVTVTAHVLAQGPDVHGQVIIRISRAGVYHRDTTLQEIPDEVYAKTYLSEAEQLKLGLIPANTSLKVEDDEYAAGTDIF